MWLVGCARPTGVSSVTPNLNRGGAVWRGLGRRSASGRPSGDGAGDAACGSAEAEAVAKRTFDATMYLLWTSNAPNSNSIPVPIGYQAWQFQASTINPGAPAIQAWTVPVTQAHGPVGGFKPADPSQPFYGYPTWSGRALEACPN